MARVATKQVDIRSRPNDEASIVGNRFRDQLIRVYDEVVPADAPKFYNNLWYRVWGGYIHSARLQLVEVNLQEPVRYIPESGWLAEVTVPYTTAYQIKRGMDGYPGADRVCIFLPPIGLRAWRMDQMDVFGTK